MAKLPEQMTQKLPRTLADLQRGERSAIALYGFRVDADHNIFATLSAELDERDPQLEYGEIWRDHSGAYHADLKGSRRLWCLKKYWRKRIVRSGPNTLLPYAENRPDSAEMATVRCGHEKWFFRLLIKPDGTSTSPRFPASFRL